MTKKNRLRLDVEDLKLAFNALREKIHSASRDLAAIRREIVFLRTESDALHLLINKRLVRAETFSLLASKIESRYVGLEILKCLKERLSTS